jgi:hypothetical protein
VPLISSAVIYLLITFQWKKYRHIYAKTRYIHDALTGNGSGLHRNNEPLLDYTLDRKSRYKPFNRDSFIGYYRGSRDDDSTREYYFPSRSPWEKSRYYYTYPYKQAHINSSLKKQTQNATSNTISSDHRRSLPRSSINQYSGNPRVWHTVGNFESSLERRMNPHRDIYM